MGDVNFLQKGIDLVTEATQKDNAKDYEAAYKLYRDALEHFMLALKC